MENFNLFHDVEHLPLRVYNRAVQAFNILEDAGEYGLRQYLDNFTDDEKKQIFVMNMFINQKGADAAREFATCDLILEE